MPCWQICKFLTQSDFHNHSFSQSKPVFVFDVFRNATSTRSTPTVRVHKDCLFETVVTTSINSQSVVHNIIICLPRRIQPASETRGMNALSRASRARATRLFPYIGNWVIQNHAVKQARWNNTIRNKPSQCRKMLHESMYC